MMRPRSLLFALDWKETSASLPKAPDKSIPGYPTISAENRISPTVRREAFRGGKGHSQWEQLGGCIDKEKFSCSQFFNERPILRFLISRVNRLHYDLRDCNSRSAFPLQPA